MRDIPILSNDRPLVRNRPWLVREVVKVTNGHHLLKFEALDGEEPARLSLSVPPEDPLPLPTEERVFDLNQLDSLASWSNRYRILAATLVRETGLLSGGRLRRGALDSHQFAPVLWFLSNPHASFLMMVSLQEMIFKEPDQCRTCRTRKGQDE